MIRRMEITDDRLRRFALGEMRLGPALKFSKVVYKDEQATKRIAEFIAGIDSAKKRQGLERIHQLLRESSRRLFGE